MSKFTCFILFAVALSLSNVNATEDERNGFRDGMRPFMAECSKIHGVTDGDISQARETKNVKNMKPCFLACIFKKAEIIDSKGKLDMETGLNKMKEFTKNADYIAKMTEVLNKCASVNDKSVNDGEEGCERAVLLATCIADSKAEMAV